MRIVHFGRFSPDKVDGPSHSVHSLALAQLQAGHEVFFYGFGDTNTTICDSAGITIRVFRRGSNPFRISSEFARTIKNNDDKIDIFNLHSVFIPTNYAVSRILAEYCHPYVVTPRGGYDPKVFARHRLKKHLYYLLFERRCVHDAAGVICLASPEVSDIRRLGFSGQIAVIPNAVATDSHATMCRKPADQLIYLGRNDIEHKGLDRLLQLFTAVEAQDDTISLEIYSGTINRKAVRDLARRLKIRNVCFHEPVFGAEKLRCLERASVYIQTSRWEAFGNTIAEAMAGGIPVALSHECNLAPLVGSLECGLIIDTYDRATAAGLIQIIKDGRMNTELGLKGRDYALEHFSAHAVEQDTTAFYTSLLGSA